MDDYHRDGITVHHADAAVALADMPTESVHAVVCDPPYGIDFMGKSWDTAGIAFDPVFWRECLRVLTPGGHLLAFGGTRTFHRLACAVEDAGAELRDTITWLYGTGFPKSLDVSKALDNAVGADETARRWQGWGTALKPASEPIVVARKPLHSTVVDAVTEYGTGALNIDGCRVGIGTGRPKPEYTGPNYRNNVFGRGMGGGPWENTDGRWPPNVVFTHSPRCEHACADGCPVAELDRQSGVSITPSTITRGGARTGASGLAGLGRQDAVPCHADSGGASRYFPVFRWEAKAPARERPRVNGTAHPTVKPLALMRWLVRLVTPPGGTVLDPFAGSGATLQAARAEGFHAIGIEQDTDYIGLIRARLGEATQDTPPVADTATPPKPSQLALDL